MVLGRHYEQLHSIKELNSVHTGDPHVQEDPKEDGERNFPEDRAEDDGYSEHDGDHKEGDPLVSDSHSFLSLARDAGGGVNSQRRDVGHGSHGGSADPGAAK